MISPRDLGAAAADRVYQWSSQLQHLRRRNPGERYRVGQLAPVLLIPGVYETWQFLRPIADRLNARGHPIWVVKQLGYNRLTIVASALLAAQFLQDHDLKSVIIVAHSKGGLIAKRMMTADDGGLRIDRLIAINTPFGGSTLARWAPTGTLRAFSPLDQTLVTLAANIDVNSRITSIYSRLDPLIPAGSALEGATNIQLPLVGHFRPLASALLFAAVENEVEKVANEPTEKPA